MFSFGKKKTAAAPQKQVAPDKKIESEKVLFNIKQQKKRLEDQIESISEQLVKLESTAKQLAKENKKTQAKRMLIAMKQKREQIVRKEGFITMLQKTEINIESAMDDMDMGNFLKEANTFLKQRVEDNEEFMEQLQDFKEIEAEMSQNSNMMMEMLKPDAEEEAELDDEYLKLVQENEAEEKMELDMKMSVMNQPLNVPNQVNVNHSAQVQKPEASTISNKFDSLLADLA